MELPVVNRFTGTEPDDLIEGYSRARHAMELAIKVVGACWPNGRDYQGGSIRNAMHEHAERMRHLRQIQAELEMISEGVLHQL